MQQPSRCMTRTKFVTRVIPVGPALFAKGHSHVLAYITGCQRPQQVKSYQKLTDTYSYALYIHYIDNVRSTDSSSVLGYIWKSFLGRQCSCGLKVTLLSSVLSRNLWYIYYSGCVFFSAIKCISQMLLKTSSSFQRVQITAHHQALRPNTAHGNKTSRKSMQAWEQL